MSTLDPRFFSAAFALLSLSAWEILAAYSVKIEFYAASPSSVAIALTRLVRDGTFFEDFAVTGAEAAVGLLVGMSLGTMVGLSVWVSARVAAAVRPIALVLGAIPIIAVAPLMIVWFGIGIPMKIAMAAMTTVFIAFSQAYRGARRASEDLVEIVAGLGATRGRILRTVVIPGSLEWVFNSLRLNVGMALLGAFMGEFVASAEGLGYRLLRSASLYNVPSAFAAALGIVILGVLFDALAAAVEERRHVLIQALCVSSKLRYAHRNDGAG